MKLFFTLVAIARNRVHTGSGLWVIFSLSVAIYSVSADTIVLKSGETLKGQITSESDLSVTISTETSTGKTDKTIAKSEIVGVTLSSPPSPTPTAAPNPSSVSPDKQWEYKCGEYGFGNCYPEIVKAGTTERAVDLDQELKVNGSESSDAEIMWAPDSKRFGFNYSPPHAHHTIYKTVAFYQLRGDKWVALRDLPDYLLRRRPDYLPKGFNPRNCAREWDELKLREWTDANTAILYAPCHGRSSEVNAAFLLTLKFDDAGNWKIIKAHQMSKKELEEEQ